MSCFQVTLFVILTIFGVIQTSESAVYYIKASEAEDCPLDLQPCLTLSQYATNSNGSDNNNIELFILPGNHSLLVNLSFSNLLSLEIYSNVSTTIECDSSSRLEFEFIDSVYVRNVKFIGCGGNIVRNVDDFLLQETTFQGKENSGTSLTLINTTAEIVRCTFVGNQFGTVMNGVRSLISLTTEVKWFLVGDVTGVIRIGGALISSFSNISISHSNFENNKAEVGGDIFTEDFSSISILNSTFSGEGLFLTSKDEPPFGGSIFSSESNFEIQNCVFRHKNATVGGAILSSMSTFRFIGSSFISNSATDHGGSVMAYRGSVHISRCKFERNFAGAGAGVATQEVMILVEASNFSHNTVVRHAAALDLYSDFPTIRGCIFEYNVANSFAGAVLFWLSHSKIYGLTDTEENGQVCNTDGQQCNGSSISSYDSLDTNTSYDDKILFISNSAPTGAAIYVINSTVYSCGSIIFKNNFATLYSTFYFLDSHGIFEGRLDISQNIGSFFMFNSNVTFTGCNRFVNGSPTKNPNASFREGGAITLVQTTLYLRGQSLFENNHAEIGGAIVATESILYLMDSVTVRRNTAYNSGGGLYLSQSELYGLRESTLIISSNSAGTRGGGIHAVSSSIKGTVTGIVQTDRKSNTTSEVYKGAQINIISNSAPRGGALYLESNSKVTLLKDFIFYTLMNHSAVTFIGNTATYGGAIYVDDESNLATCVSNPFDVNSPKSECFVRVIATHTILTFNTNYSLNNVYFDLNSASVSGSTLFGGLLDRCTVSLFNEVDRTIDMSNNQFLKYEGDGLQYLYDISTGNSMQTISSYPAQLCPCINGRQNCSQKVQIDNEFQKGQPFNLSLIAVDQIYRPVNATVQGYLQFAESNLIEGQVTPISDKCTNVTFQITSPFDVEQLTLYASDGPCKDAELSRMKVNVSFSPCICPIGFQRSRQSGTTNCECVCHSSIRPYVSRCNSRTNSFQRRVNVWISYSNQTNASGYLVYQYCPFDYCLPPNTSVPVDLNLQNGADAQCALNREGVLCGACQPGLSLSLGSSRCLSCPIYWPALFAAITIFSIVAGLGLIVLILWLNMTVAVGTLNGLLFYANIVAANRVVLLPYPEPNFITVFISWLNLELGIDFCYIDGMDTYIKTWLQLAFPIYIILLVVLLIIISRYSTRFSKLIAKRNPVATLATLILISYGKFFYVVLLAQPFSLATLTYPNNSTKSLWLPDGSVDYFSGKHIVLFIVALVILFVCIVYGFLLLCWQLLIRLPEWKIFKCLKSANLHFFMEVYHVPYAPKHRYWTGMLLLARAVIYLIATSNVSGNPQVQLISIVVVMICIILLKMLIATRIFKKWLVDALESFFYINILFLAAFTSYNLSVGNNQDGVAYTSVVLSFVVTLLIILYHVYEYTSLLSVLKKSKLVRRIKKRFSNDTYVIPRAAGNIGGRFDDFLDISDYPASEAEYFNAADARSLSPSVPTSSVVELSES